MTKRIKLTVVDWLDAAQHVGWHDSAEELSPAEIRSVGYLVYQDKKTIRLAQSVTRDGGVGDVLVIPRAWIVRRGERG